MGALVFVGGIGVLVSVIVLVATGDAVGITIAVAVAVGDGVPVTRGSHVGHGVPVGTQPASAMQSISIASDLIINLFCSYGRP